VLLLSIKNDDTWDMLKAESDIEESKALPPDRGSFEDCRDVSSPFRVTEPKTWISPGKIYGR
jgi:hypothetical protein